ncbi:type II toxin-antitoxin system ParD family antitoxin [Brevundimonas staleyi]|uniref:Type II toxin-antitoxin system ParD family antitoxin n=1 Tax=Brevundimonas staleyi TaxID=74326 RepID=A0ABW0FN72_9CAUL
MDDAPFRLPKSLESFVEEQVRSGAYADRSALINDAVERLSKKAANDEAKRQRLRAALADSVERLDRGEGIEVEDLDAFFDEIMTEATRS